MKKLLTSFFFLLLSQICFAQWTQMGLSDKSISDIEIKASEIFAITSDVGALYSGEWLDGGFIWLKIVEANAEDIAVTKSGKFFLVKDDSLFSSSNISQGWQFSNMIEQIKDSLPKSFFGYGSRKIFISPQGKIFCSFKYLTELFSSIFDGFALSNDNGLTWTTPRTDLIAGKTFIFRNQFVITVGAVVHNTGGGFYSYISSDFGNTWKGAYVPGSPLEFLSNGNIIAYGYVNSDANRPPALIMSKDTCQSWLEIDTFECQVSVSFSNGSSEYLIIGTKDSGVFLYSDEGEKLGAINEGLTNLNIQSLAYDNNGFIYAGTGNGIWRRSLSEITSVEEKRTLIPFEYFLSQNYPNPFNPSTTIKYSIPKQFYVTLKVYDILGREIANLVNETKQSGEYEVEFNGASLPSGIYFYQLKAGQFIETKKMILIK